MPQFPVDPHSIEQMVRAADARTVGAATGLVLLVAGARLYRVAVMAPGFVLGLWLAHDHLPAMAPGWRLGITVGAGMLGALLSSGIEQLAVRLAGALLVAGLTHAVLPLAWEGVPPWWAAPAAGFLGLALFPSVYRRLLPLITALLGALVIAWSLGRGADLLLILGVAAVGLVVQIILGRSSGDAGKKA